MAYRVGGRAVRIVDARRVGKGADATCPPSSAVPGRVGTLRFAHPTRASLFRGLYAGLLGHDRRGAAQRYIVPPRLERSALAGELHAHAAGIFDPFVEALLRDSDDDGNVGAESALDQEGKPLAVALALAEAVDDQKVGAGIERLANPRTDVLQPAHI